jgi:uncharacterized cupin superfamily protein
MTLRQNGYALEPGTATDGPPLHLHTDEIVMVLEGRVA